MRGLTPWTLAWEWSRRRFFSFGYWLALAAFPLSCGWKSDSIGQDVNFDYFNYHAYNAWAFLHGRTFTDVFPAGAQTLINPLVDVPSYLLQAHLAPKVAAYFIGFEQGLGPLLVVLIARKISHSRWIGLLAGATAAISGGFSSELGNDMGDSIVAPFLLLGVLFAMIALERAPKPKISSDEDGSSGDTISESYSRRNTSGTTRWWIASGLAAGIGGGLKFAELPIAFGMVVATSFMMGGLRIRLRMMLESIFGFLAGMFATAGYWSIALWQHYGDPIAFVAGTFLRFQDPYFPLSPQAPSTVPSASLLPLLHFLWTPASLYLHPLVYSELPVREASLAIAGVMLIVLLAGGLLLGVLATGTGIFQKKALRFRWRSRSYDRLERIAASQDRFLIVTFVVSLYVWSRVFNIYRYLIPLELLGSVVVLALGRRLVALTGGTPRRRSVLVKALLPFFLAICLISIETESPSAYWDRVAFGPTWASIATPEMLQNNKLNALVGVGSPSYPASFVIPLLKGRFIAIGGINGASSLNMLTPPTVRLLDTAFAKVRRNGGSVIGFWRNTASSAGPQAIINALDRQKMKQQDCESEIMGLGSALQLFVFCRFLPVR